MKVEGEGNRGGKEIQVFGVYIICKWKPGRADKEEGKDGRGGDERGVGYRKKEIWKGLGKEDVAI